MINRLGYMVGLRGTTKESGKRGSQGQQFTGYETPRRQRMAGEVLDALDYKVKQGASAPRIPSRFGLGSAEQRVLNNLE